MSDSKAAESKIGGFAVVAAYMIAQTITATTVIISAKPACSPILHMFPIPIVNAKGLCRNESTLARAGRSSRNPLRLDAPGRVRLSGEPKTKTCGPAASRGKSRHWSITVL
jgi:hypothetical protein